MDSQLLHSATRGRKVNRSDMAEELVILRSFTQRSLYNNIIYNIYISYYLYKPYRHKSIGGTYAYIYTYTIITFFGTHDLCVIYFYFPVADILSENILFLYSFSVGAQLTATSDSISLGHLRCFILCTWKKIRDRSPPIRWKRDGHASEMKCIILWPTTMSRGTNNNIIVSFFAYILFEYYKNMFCINYYYT